MVVFGAILFFVLGLAAWAASDRHYAANLKPAITFAGQSVPVREFERERRFQLVRFYVEAQIPREFENDPRVQREKARYEGIALDKLIEYEALRLAARREGITVSAADVETRFEREFSQFRSRHVLVAPAEGATDKEAADKAALAKAQAVVAQLRAAPMDQQLWNRVATESSSDPGSKDSGGELGFASKGQFVKEYEDAAAALAIGAISDPVKSQFGYHVLQVQERKGPQESEIVQRYQSSGFTVQDLKDHIRWQLLREEVGRRAEQANLVSPTAQIRLQRITINTPPPVGGDFAMFTEGLRKIGEVNKALQAGEDFGEVAKKHSDHPSAQSGGDVGWFARGMIADVRAEDELFALEAGKNSRSFSTTRQTTFYRVVEKDPSRALSDEQRTSIAATAFDHWLDRQKREHGAKKHRPGFELD